MSAPFRLDVLHADNHVLAVHKPAGEPSVPDASGDRSTLERAKAWVAERYAKPGAVFLGVVHRLDRPVSGVLVFARTSKAAGRLSAAFRDRRVRKVYWAVGLGMPAAAEGVAELWLAKDRARNVVRRAAPGAAEARLARTRWRVLRRGPRGTVLLELEPETGRPHQLRVTARELGATLAGDLKYGAPEPLPDASVALHARLFELDHPTTGERLSLRAALPALAVWDLARREEGPASEDADPSLP